MISTVYLTTKGTKAKRINKTPATNFAMIGNSFTRPRLWSFIQEHNLCAIDNVCLDTCNVQKPLNLINSNHVMVRGSSNLIMHKNQSEN